MGHNHTRQANMFVRDAMAGSEGDSAEVLRLFPLHFFMNFDPFVLWDDFSISAGAGFPDHPHRGFEGITYVMQGAIKHADNLGNDSTVAAGGLQRFTAGKGIIHSEMPSPDAVTRGIQMWVNLPADLKKLEPDYQQVDADEVSEQIIEGVRVRHLSGEGAPLRLHTEVVYQDIVMPAGTCYVPGITADMRGLIYVLEGEVSVSGGGHSEVAGKGQSCFVEYVDRLEISCEKASRMMLCFGEPHNQPIHQHGPFVD